MPRAAKVHAVDWGNAVLGVQLWGISSLIVTGFWGNLCSSLKDLEFLCSFLWDVKTCALLVPWQLGGLLSSLVPSSVFIVLRFSQGYWSLTEEALCERLWTFEFCKWRETCLLLYMLTTTTNNNNCINVAGDVCVLEQWQIASPASEKKCTRLVNTKTGERTLMDWGHDTPGCKIWRFCKMCLLGGMYRSYIRECWCNCCCWDVVVVIGKVMILSSNPRALTCFVWGVSFFFDCCGRTSISCQNVGNILLRRVSVGEVHRVVLRHVEIGT